jgi:GNAT superfamily N-acetyltransferase
MRPIVRAARPDDATTILRFVRALAAYEREPDAVEATEDVLRAQLASERPPFECAIAELAGAPVGLALWFATYSTWRGRPGIHLEDLWVEPAARGHGVALALLAHVARTLLARGGARLEWRVLEWNELALGLYRRIEAVEVVGWKTMRLDGEALGRLAAHAAPEPRQDRSPGGPTEG